MFMDLLFFVKLSHFHQELYNYYMAILNTNDYFLL